jgi:hypothetical protein
MERAAASPAPLPLTTALGRPAAHQLIKRSFNDLYAQLLQQHRHAEQRLGLGSAASSSRALVALPAPPRPPLPLPLGTPQPPAKWSTSAWA